MQYRSEAEQFEKIPTRIFEDSETASKQLAREVSELIRERATQDKGVVLGLATGSTPVGFYRELIRLHREEGLSFRNVTTFNLDEYYPIERENRESYYCFMREQLFRHIDIPESQTHVPDGRIARDAVYDHCRAYEQAIEAAGGLDFQVLGIGRTGHIGFNEPGSPPDSLTRLVRLESLTRKDAARDFLGLENVPLFGISMGVGSIMKARRVALMAWGQGKAGVIRDAVEGEVTTRLPASLLQAHNNVTFLVDEAAASQLTRRLRPWLCGAVQWTPSMRRRAVLWLSQQVDKPILKLVEDDYSEHGLTELVMESGSAYALNIRIFNEVQHTITGWPGGKPDADDTTRPERATPYPKRVVVFAPEPMEDVAGMGGTLHRLKNQGHDVAVVYMTSGNLAVSDDRAQFVAELLQRVGGREPEDSIEEKDTPGPDNQSFDTQESISFENHDARTFKGLIREGEARAALQRCGLPAGSARFLKLRFYEEGHYRNFKPTDADLRTIVSLLQETRPHQIYATGNQSDPQSLAGVCFSLLIRSLESVAGADWFPDCRVWLYRGGAEEWSMERIHMAVPLSPDELSFNIKAIYQHESQRSQTPADLVEHREFWPQVEADNRRMAACYDALGLAEYEAIEVFQKLSPKSL